MKTSSAEIRARGQSDTSRLRRCALSKFDKPCRTGASPATADDQAS